MGPESEAVVQRFGKFRDIAKPGLHFKLPYGIELLDVRFKWINYKAGVIDKIFARMSSERLQIAERFRSEGASEVTKILGRKERDLLSIDSEAYRKEQEIKGKADVTATGIYATAYSSSESAADFYQFVKTLETYDSKLGKDTTMVLTTDSDLFRLFKQIDNAPASGTAGEMGNVLPPNR